VGKKAKQPIRVLHAPLNYANQAYVLSQALRARGVDSHLLRYQWNSNPGATRYGYEDDRVADITRKDWFGDMLRVVQGIAAEGFDGTGPCCGAWRATSSPEWIFRSSGWRGRG
jgi:hypothetical protein